MITMTYGTHVIELRNPEFGDIDRSEINVIITRGTGDQLLTRKVAGRPVYYYYEWHVNIFCKDDVDAFRAFLDLSAGDVISITDHEANTYNAIIITNPIEITEVQPNEAWETMFVVMELP